MSPAFPPEHSHPSANPRSAAREARILADMQRWLERAVIGLNLCPFAKAVHARGQVHWVVSPAVSTPALEQDLLREASIARAVQAFPEAETIYGNNIRTLERLGLDGWNALGVGGSAPEAGEGP